MRPPYWSVQMPSISRISEPVDAILASIERFCVYNQPATA
jgi:hypothetical protein